MKNKNIVNLGAIRQGMKRFQFLLNCCEPGTIPDASILAAALDLVSSVSCVYIKKRCHITFETYIIDCKIYRDIISLYLGRDQMDHKMEKFSELRFIHRLKAE